MEAFVFAPATTPCVPTGKLGEDAGVRFLPIPAISKRLEYR